MEAPDHLCGRRFETSAEIEVSLHAFAAAQGYALVRQRTTTNLTGLHKVWMVCDRNTEGASKADQRQAASRGTSCKMSVSFTRRQDPVSLEDYWDFQVIHGSHNHLASLAPSAHPQLRRLALTPAVKKTIVSASAAAVAPRQIMTMIRQGHGETPLQPRDIYNVIDREKAAAFRGKSRLESLANDLTEDNWWWRMDTNDKGQVSHFFFATPTSVELLRDYPEVILMDCTYKTNRFGMPLLVVVGMTPLLTTFYAAFVFLRGEKQQDYAWALARLHELYETAIGRPAGPTTVLTDRDQALSNALAAQWTGTAHILCIWHINKGVLTNCKKYFETNESWDIFFKKWCETWQAGTVEEGLAAWRDLISSYSGRYEPLVTYLETTWMPLKHKFWVSHTSKVFTLGNRATSRVEGAHAGLKAWLNSSQGDLKKVKECTELLLAAQQEKLKGLLATGAVRTPHCVQIEFFQGLIGHVTPAALELMLPQLRLARKSRAEDQKPCTKVFTTTMGLPCSHTMRDRLASSELLLLGDLHPFWLIRVSRSSAGTLVPPPRPLLNPATPRNLREVERSRQPSRQPSRRRGTGVTSTRRGECSFERAERAFERRGLQQSQRVRHYHPTRLSRSARQASGPGETCLAGEEQPLQQSATAEPSQATKPDTMQVSQGKKVSEFLKELPSSDDPTLEAIRAILMKSREVIQLVTRRSRSEDCDVPMQSIETTVSDAKTVVEVETIDLTSVSKPAESKASPETIEAIDTELRSETVNLTGLAEVVVESTRRETHSTARPVTVNLATLRETAPRETAPRETADSVASIDRDDEAQAGLRVTSQRGTRRPLFSKPIWLSQPTRRSPSPISSPQLELRQSTRRRRKPSAFSLPPAKRSHVCKTGSGLSEAVLAARKAARDKWVRDTKEWLETPYNPAPVPGMDDDLAATFKGTASEDEEEEDLMYEVELRRLQESGGEATPLWAALAISQGRPAARQHNTHRQQVSPSESRVKTLPPYKTAEKITSTARETCSETQRSSGRATRPSRRLLEGRETTTTKPAAQSS